MRRRRVAAGAGDGDAGAGDAARGGDARGVGDRGLRRKSGSQGLCSTVLRCAAVILGLLVVLGVHNHWSLHGADDGRSLEQVLGGPVARVEAADVRRLSMHDFAQAFRLSGALPEDVRVPMGFYTGEQMPLGFTYLAGATFITEHVMGGAAGRWAGKLIDADHGKGLNRFEDTTGKVTRSLPFSVTANHASSFDGAAATLLDYANTTSLFFKLMRDEVRCINDRVCLGFGGFVIAGGPANGSPFLLHREGLTTAEVGANRGGTKRFLW